MTSSPFQSQWRETGTLKTALWGTPSLSRSRLMQTNHLWQMSWITYRHLRIHLTISDSLNKGVPEVKHTCTCTSEESMFFYFGDMRNLRTCFKTQRKFWQEIVWDGQWCLPSFINLCIYWKLSMCAEALLNVSQHLTPGPTASAEATC